MQLCDINSQWSNKKREWEESKREGSQLDKTVLRVFQCKEAKNLFYVGDNHCRETVVDECVCLILF